MADTDKSNQIKQLELTANVFIIPKPRFYKIVVSCLLFILLLWNQGLIVDTFRGASDRYCQVQRNAALQLPTPVPQSKPIIVPETPSVNPSDLESIRGLRRFYLAANQNDGKIVLRTGGSISWRFNNPGKMLISDFTKSMGSIGSDGTTAIFPSYEVGRKAMYAYLFTPAAKYFDKKMSQIFPETTLKTILNDTGISQDAILKDLTEDQKNKLMDAIQKAEDYIPGKVTVFDNEEDFKKRGW